MTKELRQREPRVRNDAYLAYLREQMCCCCKLKPSEAAHIRMPNLKLGKPLTGMGTKPDDKYAVPLCAFHHRTGGKASQHSMAEDKFWNLWGLDPFKIAALHYAKFLLKGGSHKETKKRKSPKIKSGSKLPKGRKIQSRGFRK